MLPKVIEHCEKTNAPVALLMFDIDYFKKINDVFGHDSGDVVLKNLVVKLTDALHKSPHLLARMGGEEFAVVLPNCSLPKANELALSCLDAIRKLIVIHSQAQIRFTVSIGLALRLDQEDSSSWLKRADLALYRAKNNGRDQVVIADNTIPSSGMAAS